MNEKFFTFLDNPNLSNYISLRATVISRNDFNPCSNELQEIPALIENQQYEEVVITIADNLFPNYFLSPGAHMKLGYACNQLGREKEALMQNMLAALLLEGIEMSGNGSETSPYLISRSSDTLDFLFAKSLSLKSRNNIIKNGKEYEVLSVEEQNDIWFDISDTK